jgi:hypothetical protein
MGILGGEDVSWRNGPRDYWSSPTALTEGKADTSNEEDQRPAQRVRCNDLLGSDGVARSRHALASTTYPSTQ